MHNARLKFGHLIPENNHQYAVDGIVICCDCGTQETTVLTFGIYCRACRNFKLFKEMSKRCYAMTGTVLDLD